MTARKKIQKKKVHHKKKQFLMMQMRKTRVFQSGNSRAVRLPKDFQLSLGPVNIYMRDNEIIIRKTPMKIGELWKSVPKLPSDAKLEVPDDNLPPERDVLWD